MILKHYNSQVQDSLSSKWDEMLHKRTNASSNVSLLQFLSSLINVNREIQIHLLAVVAKTEFYKPTFTGVRGLKRADAGKVSPLSENSTKIRQK